MLHVVDRTALESSSIHLHGRPRVAGRNESGLIPKTDVAVLRINAPKSNGGSLGDSQKADFGPHGGWQWAARFGLQPIRYGSGSSARRDERQLKLGPSECWNPDYFA
jgi:hypothetical protein